MSNYLRLLRINLNEQNVESELDKCENPPKPLILKENPKKRMRTKNKRGKPSKYTQRQIDLCTLGIVPKELKRSQCYGIRNRRDIRNNFVLDKLFGKIVYECDLSDEMWSKIKNIVKEA